MTTQSPTWAEVLADMTDDELLQLGNALQQDRADIMERFGKVEAEVLRRMHDAGASMIRKDHAMAERTALKRYQWNVSTIWELAPDHVAWEPEQVVPGHYEVRNTRALNNFIDKLGDTTLGRALQDARRIDESGEHVKFHIVTEDGEIK